MAMLCVKCFFQRAVKVRLLPRGKMSQEPRGCDSHQGSGLHTHVREQDRPTDGGQVQPRVPVVRQRHGDEVGPGSSQRWPGPGDDR